MIIYKSMPSRSSGTDGTCPMISRLPMLEGNCIVPHVGRRYLGARSVVGILCEPGLLVWFTDSTDNFGKALTANYCWVQQVAQIGARIHIWRPASLFSILLIMLPSDLYTACVVTFHSVVTITLSFESLESWFVVERVARDGFREGSREPWKTSSNSSSLILPPCTCDLDVPWLLLSGFAEPPTCCI